MDFKILAYTSKVNKFEDDAFFQSIYEKVKPYRKNKIDILKRREDKNLSLAAEYLLIKALEDFGLNYDKEEIEVDSNGKPYLKSNRAFFNISHSKDRVFIVVSTLPIGCDIQFIKEFNIEIARRFFTLNEYKEIVNQFSVEKTKEYFYKVWCAKESFTKCIGLGLKQPLNSFEIKVNDNDISLVKNGIENEYRFYSKTINEYQFVICIETNIDISNKIEIVDL